MKLEATLVKKGCRHSSKGISLVDYIGIVQTDNILVDMGQCKKCGAIVAKITDCGRYYTLKINEVE